MSFGFGYGFWHAEILNFYMSRFNSLLCFLDFMCHLERLSPFLGFPCGSAGKESTCGTGDLGSTPGLGRSPGEGKGYLLQYSGLENSMDCIVHGVAKRWTQLSHFYFPHSDIRKEFVRDLF